MNKKAIGIFDSGIGGLTCVKQIKRLMPNEDIIYFGDTSRVPYGGRSEETIKKYATQDINFLRSHDIKMIIAACGTVSANLPLETINKLDVEFSGVLLPAVKAACKATTDGRIGVIATPATIKSGAYGKAIREISPDIQIFGKACPMFVPLVENGYINKGNPITKAIAKEYLDVIKENKVDTLILGCTHYPVIKDIIAEQMGDKVTLIDPGLEAARFAKELFDKKDMRNSVEHKGECSYFVSDDEQNFAFAAGMYLEEQIEHKVEKIDIESY